MSELDAGSSLRHAELLLDARRFEEAAAMGYELSARELDDPRPLLIASRAESMLGRPNKAEDAASSAILRDPHFVPSYRLLAAARVNAAYQTRDRQERRRRGRSAMDAAERAVALDPDDLGSMWILAEASALSGKRRRATEMADAAAAVSPEQPSTWLVRSRVARLAGDYAVAEADAREALRLNPQSYEANNELGLALGGRGKRAEALSQFRATAALDPSRPTAPRNFMAYGVGLSYLVIAIVLSPLIALNVILWIIASAVVHGVLWSSGPSKRFLEARSLAVGKWRSEHAGRWPRREGVTVPPGTAIRPRTHLKFVVAFTVLAAAVVMVVVGVVYAIVGATSSGADAGACVVVAVLFAAAFVPLYWSASRRPDLHAAATAKAKRTTS